MSRLDTLQAALQSVLGDRIRRFQRERGEITIHAAAADYLAVATTLRDHPELRFEQAIDALEARGISRELLLRRALITPSCGAGALSEELAERVLQVLRELSLLLRERYA